MAFTDTPDPSDSSVDPTTLRTDILRGRYLDELIASTRLLESFESAAVAEAWASGAVAEWAALDGSSGSLARELESSSPLGAGLVAWMYGGPAPSSGADWVGDVGQHTVSRVVRMLDPNQPDETGWILEYVAPSGVKHDLSATIVGDVLVGLSVGPSGLALAAVEDDANGFTVEESSIDDVVAQLERCVTGPLDTLSESAEATLPLVMRRLDLRAPVGEVVSAVVDRTMPPRELEDDRYAAGVVTSALRAQFDAPLTDAVEAAKAAFEARVAAREADALTLFEIAGMTVVDELDLRAFVRLAGAYLAPVDLSPHSDAEFAALVELEPADWTGVVLGMARAAAGTEIDGDTLVTFVNRAPEITTTIPKRDAPRIAWTFEKTLFAWETTGVLDEHGCVTEVAKWILPRAAQALWADQD